MLGKRPRTRQYPIALLILVSINDQKISERIQRVGIIGSGQALGAKQDDRLIDAANLAERIGQRQPAVMRIVKIPRLLGIRRGFLVIAELTIDFCGQSMRGRPLCLAAGRLQQFLEQLVGAGLIIKQGRQLQSAIKRRQPVLIGRQRKRLVDGIARCIRLARHQQRLPGS